MPIIEKWSFDDPSFASNSSIVVEVNKVTINYPCKVPNKCTSVRMLLPRGRYLFELGGGNGYIIPKLFIPGERPTDSPLAGGYVSGILSLKHPTNIILNIGGHGDKVAGGYNGGGSGGGPVPLTGGGGGGGTDVRIEKNDPFHRILVAGGGGGSDDQTSDKLESNDGNGGCGGGIQSQSFFVLCSYVSGFEANQSSGFSFFQGETGKNTGSSHPKGYISSFLTDELSGAGGGWFGGFSSHCNNGGASGGSSFALTSNSTVPLGKVHIFDKNYVSVQEGYYAFNPVSSPYLFENVTHRRGVWNGNGFAIITLLSSLKPNICFSHYLVPILSKITYTQFGLILLLSH